MGMIRLLAAPIRSIVRFPLFQLAVVVAIIVLLQAAGDNTLFGKIFDLLDELVGASVQLFGQLFEVKSFTRSGLTAGLMIAYVYLVCLVIFYLLGIVIRWIVDLIGWGNVFWLRNAIARELLGKVGRNHPALFGSGGRFGWIEHHGFDNYLRHGERSGSLGEGVEEGFLVLLHIAVVSHRQALHGEEQ